MKHASVKYTRPDGEHQCPSGREGALPAGQASGWSLILIQPWRKA